MSGQNGLSETGDKPEQNLTASEKGKMKATSAANEDISMDEDDESSEEESAPEDNAAEDIEPEDEDNMEEIDTDNIIADGRRTRGKEIDFAKAAQEAGEEDEDEDEDDDFEDSDDEMKE